MTLEEALAEIARLREQNDTLLRLLDASMRRLTVLPVVPMPPIWSPYSPPVPWTLDVTWASPAASCLPLNGQVSYEIA